MRYYSLSFLPRGPYINIPDDSPRQQDALANQFKQEGIVEKVLDKLKCVDVEWRHEYSWPDGSCYKWVRTPEVITMSKIIDLVNIGLQLTPNEIRLIGVRDVGPDYHINGSSDGKTVKELFDGDSPHQD